MSKGYGAHGKLLEHDSKQIVYAYCSYNVNNPGYKEKYNELDGRLILDINIFKTIDSYRRYKGNSSDRERKQLTINPDEWDYSTLREKGMVHIINSSEAWLIDDASTDKHAVSLIYKIINEYKKLKKLPETIVLFY